MREAAWLDTLGGHGEIVLPSHLFRLNRIACAQIHPSDQPHAKIASVGYIDLPVLP